MAVPHSTVIYDVHDFKVYELLTDTGASPTYGAAVDIPGIAEVSADPNLLTAELKGDATIIAKKGRIDKFTGSATYGKIALDAMPVIFGGDTTDPAVDHARWRLQGVNSLPYFKCEFKIDDVESGLGSVIVVIYKCQLTGGTLISGQTDEFGQPSFEFEGIALESNDNMIDVDLYEDVTALSA
jgi:hypothetical protein